MTYVPRTLTITLTEEEDAQLQALTQEYSLTEQSEALKRLLQDVGAFYDDLWDKKFADSGDILARMADDALAAHLRGETEEITCDEDESSL